MKRKNSAFLPAVLGAGLAVGAAIVYRRQKNSVPVPGALPAPQMNLEKELVKRMPDLIYYDRFSLDVQPVINLETGGIVGGEVLCEGVETEEQHRFVLEAGCHYCQGFLFYRPMEAAQFLYLMGGKG